MFRDIFRYVNDDNFKVVFNTEKVLINSYDKVILFDDDLILVKCFFGFLKIKGKSLSIKKHVCGELVIEGKISSILVED